MSDVLPLRIPPRDSTPPSPALLEEQPEAVSATAEEIGRDLIRVSDTDLSRFTKWRSAPGLLFNAIQTLQQGRIVKLYVTGADLSGLTHAGFSVLKLYGRSEGFFDVKSVEGLEALQECSFITEIISFETQE